MESVNAAHRWETPYTQANEIDNKTMDQQHPRKVFEQAVALLKAGRRDEAETLCRNTLERDPGDINFVALLGSILADKGDLDEAEILLELQELRTAYSIDGGVGFTYTFGSIYNNVVNPRFGNRRRW